MRNSTTKKQGLWRGRRLGALCLSAGVAAGVMLPVSMASADEAAGSTANVAEMPGVPEGLTTLAEMPAGGGSPIPEETREAISELSSSSLDNEILEFKWNHDDASLSIFTHNIEAVAAAADATGLFPADQKIDYIPAAVTKSQLESTVESFVATLAASPQGLGDVVSVAPSSNGSRLTVGVTELPAQARRAAPLPSEVDGLEVAFEQVDESVPTTRVRNSSPMITGGYFAGQGSACSTGWPVRRAQDTTYGNLSADHCGKALNSMWTWGTSGQGTAPINVGLTTGQAAGGSDLEVFLGSTASAVYPYVYTTNNNDSTTGIPIRGYANTVVGDRLCYSGAFSGLVCGNEVTSASSYICYAGFQCYWIATTTQIQGQPAVGNGDSGGPVFGIVQRADGTLGAYGVGINSGITGGSTSCTGDPGYQRSDTDFRLCSKFVMFAPVARFMNAQSNFVMLISPN
jgi:hypothetical protein